MHASSTARPTLLPDVLTRPLSASPSRWSSSSTSQAGLHGVDALAGASLGDGVVKLDCGSGFADGHASVPALPGSARRQPGRSAEGRARGRRSDPIIVVFASAGRGDAEPFRLGVTDVRRGGEALVAIGDGADGEPARRACSSSCGTEARRDGGGCTRRRTIVIAMVMVIVIGTGGSVGSRWEQQCSGRR